MTKPARAKVALDKLYTNAEAAEYLRIKPQTLTRKRNGKSGDRGPRATYVGRSPRYSGRAIVAYLTAGITHA